MQHSEGCCIFFCKQNQKIIINEQLSLFTERDSHDIFIENAPSHLSAIPEAKFIVISHISVEIGEIKRYTMPLAFKPHEASIVLEDIKGFIWQLDEAGYPVQLHQMLEHIKYLIDVVQI